MTTPIERLAYLVVGTVESVAPSEIFVLLELDAPHTTALNAGSPTAFPRLNSYVLIPKEAGATVGYIAWMGIERSPYPRRPGLKDFGLIDLPFPLRKMKVVPVGTLLHKRVGADGKPQYSLSRGVMAFPSVGDQVLIPTDDQLRSIVAGDADDQRVRIGTAPMSAGAAIHVDPDKLFGRHLAVLGNTGSGKSCSVAGLIRWSIEAAQAKRADGSPPNARFIILDPNGEYAPAFEDWRVTGRVRVFRPGDMQNPLTLPAWMWNSHEWSAVTNAQPGTQRPLLMQALRNLRAGRVTREPLQVTAVRQLRLYKSKLELFLADASGQSYTGFPHNKNAGGVLVNLTEVLSSIAGRGVEVAQRTLLQAIVDQTQTVVNRRSNTRSGVTYFNDFSILDFEPLVVALDAAIDGFPRAPVESTSSEDVPVRFEIGRLADTVDDLSTDGTSNANMANFIGFLTLRIRSLLADSRLSSVIAPADPLSLSDWLSEYIGSDQAANGQIAILDLSLVPSDTVHIVIAVLARIVFEALQRQKKASADGLTLPTTLVLEEAHTFVRRGTDEEGGPHSPSRLCRESFERIAREGRKFGLGLVLSSQRPSELSPTVLAQCNTFLLHRIVNDSDQGLVAKLVPDNVGGLLRELPSLPSRQAILLGWATPIPMLVEMRDLKKEYQPRSSDPAFWHVWTGAHPGSVDWPAIADDWTEGFNAPPLPVDAADTDVTGIAPEPDPAD